MCHSRTCTQLCALRLPDHRPWYTGKWCLLLLCALCQSKWFIFCTRPCRRRKEPSMKLKEMMTRDVEVIHPDDSIQAAARKMRDRDIGFLPVYDGDELIGVLTDRDLAIRVLANGTHPEVLLGRDIVT